MKQLSLYPQDRGCAAPTAARVPDVFTDPIAIGAPRIPGIRFIADPVYQWVATHVIVFPERRHTVSHTPALADGTCEGQLTNPRYFLPSCK